LPYRWKIGLINYKFLISVNFKKAILLDTMTESANGLVEVDCILPLGYLRVLLNMMVMGQ